jgi:chorismate mutase / prephenate dehydratase
VKVAYQGPHSEIAAGNLFPDVQLVPELSFDDAFTSLERGTVAAAVVPVEHSRTGAVADVYDLLRVHVDARVLAEAIVQEPSVESYTRCFAIVRAGETQAASRIAPSAMAGPMKTSLVYATKNVPGALIRSLQPFAVARIQLTKIESRPSRGKPWEYVFYLDFEGDPSSTHVADALEVMRASCEWVHVLGTYRAARGVLAS